MELCEVDKIQPIFGMMRSKGKWGRISRNSTPFATQPCANLPNFLLLRCPTKYPYDELKEDWGLSNPTLSNFLICAKSAWKRPARSEVDSTSLIFHEVCQTPRKVPDHMGRYDFCKRLTWSSLYEPINRTCLKMRILQTEYPFIFEAKKLHLETFSGFSGSFRMSWMLGCASKKGQKKYN